MFLHVLRDVKVSYGYVSNFSYCVDLKQRIICGLKRYFNATTPSYSLEEYNLLPVNVLKQLIEK